MTNLIKFFITVIIIFSTFSSYSKDLNLPKNLIIYEKPKEYKDVAFKNTLEKDINLIDYDGKLLLMNFSHVPFLCSIDPGATAFIVTPVLANV